MPAIPSFAPDDLSGALVDRVLAVAHLPTTASVAVIGHRTLPLLLALMRRGCTCVRSLRPDGPAPDHEAAELAWIVDVANEDELDSALQAAHSRTIGSGRVIVEMKECVCREGLATFRDHALAAGLDVVSFDHVARRAILADATRQTSR